MSLASMISSLFLSLSFRRRRNVAQASWEEGGEERERVGVLPETPPTKHDKPKLQLVDLPVPAFPLLTGMSFPLLIVGGGF